MPLTSRGIHSLFTRYAVQTKRARVVWARGDPSPSPFFVFFFPFPHHKLESGRHHQRDWNEDELMTKEEGGGKISKKNPSKVTRGNNLAWGTFSCFCCHAPTLPQPHGAEAEVGITGPRDKKRERGTQFHPPGAAKTLSIDRHTHGTRVLWDEKK